MAKNKFKVEPGMLCAYDKENCFNQSDTGISHVFVIRRRKHRPFGKSVWMVKNADDPHSEPFPCGEWHLSPCNMQVIRYPSTLPDFNTLDLVAIKYIATMLQDDALDYAIKRCYDESKNCNSQTYEKYKKRLMAIYEKIKFCVEMRDV